MGDVWNVEQYEKFKDERRQPFVDLLAGLVLVPGGRAIDFGCGPGALTAELAEQLQVADALGVDGSAAMLADAWPRARPGLRFVHADMTRFTPDGPVDVIVANASLHYTGAHAAVLGRWASFLAPGGQLAVQVPANADHPAHRLAAEVAAEGPFAALWGGEGPPPDPVSENVLSPEAYAACLHELGLVDLRVQLRVYPHLLPSTEAVVEWVKGTTLNRFRERMPPDLFDRYLALYRERLVGTWGVGSPFLYTFKRILFWARRA